MTTTPSPPGRVGRVRITLLVALVGGSLATAGIVRPTDTLQGSRPVVHGILPRTASSPEPIAAQRARAVIDATTSTNTSTTAAPPVVAARPLAAQAVEDTTLHSPEDVPDPSAKQPIAVIGRIQIPTIGLDAELRDQITQESIDLGPSHWPGTAMPGGYGNAVIAGHRNSHTAPFHDTGNLSTGDMIILIDATGRSFTYTVTEMFVVDPSAVWITQQKPGHTLTVFTCHPIGSSSQRLVIRATLSEAKSRDRRIR